MILSRTARSAAAFGGLRSLTRSSTRTECRPSDQGRFLRHLAHIDTAPVSGFDVTVSVAAPQPACFDFAAMIKPGKAEKGAARRARGARLWAAWGENLRRRKERARGRKAEDGAAADAGIGTAPDFRRNPGGKV